MDTDQELQTIKPKYKRVNYCTVKIDLKINVLKRNWEDLLKYYFFRNH